MIYSFVVVINSHRKHLPNRDAKIIHRISFKGLWNKALNENAEEKKDREPFWLFVGQ